MGKRALALALSLLLAAGLLTSPAAAAAVPSDQTVTVEGTPVRLQMYALRDAGGNLTNYVRLRDLASLLDGTPARFNVTWEGGVRIETATAYIPDGTEFAAPFAGDRPCTRLEEVTYINGKPASLDAILLRDDAGRGYTYCQLRDLGAALGFFVGWSRQEGITLSTGTATGPGGPYRFTLQPFSFDSAAADRPVTISLDLPGCWDEAGAYVAGKWGVDFYCAGDRAGYVMGLGYYESPEQLRFVDSPRYIVQVPGGGVLAWDTEALPDQLDPACRAACEMLRGTMGEIAATIQLAGD